MTGVRRVAALAVPVDVRSAVSFREFTGRTPLLTVAVARPPLLVTLTLPERLEAGHVEFARQLAAKAFAYAVAVERRYRGLPPLPDAPVPYTLTPGAHALLDEPESADTAPTGQEVTA